MANKWGCISPRFRPLYAWTISWEYNATFWNGLMAISTIPEYVYMESCEYRSRIVWSTEGSLIKDRLPKSSALSRIGGFRRSGRLLSFDVLRAVSVVSTVRDYNHELTGWQGVDGVPLLPRGRIPKRPSRHLHSSWWLCHWSMLLQSHRWGLQETNTAYKNSRVSIDQFRESREKKKGGPTCQRRKHQSSWFNKRFERTSKRVSYRLSQSRMKRRAIRSPRIASSWLLGCRTVSI
jgi:hypothetical protein